MGKLAGFGSANVKMIRQGMMVNPDPDALYPVYFVVDIENENYEKAWADGLVMFHNPNALHPVDPNNFPDISHIKIDLDTGECYAISSPNEVFTSITHVLFTKPEGVEK